MPDPAPIAKYRKNLTKALDKRTKLGRGEALLAPWELAFAEWLAHSVAQRTSMKTQLEIAMDLAGEPVTYGYIKNLKNREEFREYYVELQKDALRRARSMVEKRLPQGVKAHFEGLQMALDTEDHRSIPAYTVPILDRAMPKKAEIGAVTAVKIELSPKQHALLDETIPEVEVEVIDDE